MVSLVICSRCGADNTPDSLFCKYCGTPLGNVQAAPQPGAPPPPTDLSQRMAETGKELGDEIGRIGQRFGTGIAHWWYSTLGILSPIILGFIWVVMVHFALLITDMIASKSESPQFWKEVGNLIADDFLLLAGLMFAGSFHVYFYVKYRRIYRWIAPVSAAAMVTAWAWVLAQVLILAGLHSEHPGFGDAGELLETILIAIFVLGILVGYAMLWFSLVSPANWDKPERRDQSGG